MGTHIHVSGLSYFCTNDTLRQAFIPFGTVVLAQVLRDECGHALGTGIVHMARAEDLDRVFNAHQRFEIAGSRVDLWEPEEPGPPQTERRVETRAVRRDQDTGYEKSEKALKPLAWFGRRLAKTLAPLFRTVRH
jgi:RNA recognition motif. (a.k.a. RRM, RBD, or RNP domain)